ncbi:phospholipase D-like domain-containing protein [Kribbella solani]|uniref:phospholipase D-like domain-containing protein n=1 Tax=Kribbella solani TaxID=236067 RepID=UPI0029BAFD29|nr:phospholipase D family protein [Kribbella solani]MDX2970554.1 phospholipase D family protein [Kribbella solani]
MADIDALIKKYFVQPEDVVLPSQPMPLTSAGNKITPLIDGTTYFNDLKAQLDLLGRGTPEENKKQFIYLTGWWLHLVGGKVDPAPGGSGVTVPAVELDKPFSLDGPAAAALMTDLLKAKARAGVDVRVLGWASFAIMANNFNQARAVQGGLISVRSTNIGTLAAIKDLRTEPTLADKVWVNILTHSAGAAHTKLVIVGSDSGAIGYTGGMDFAGDRHGLAPHPTRQWHDVQARVEGPAVQALHDYFRDMWNEIRVRKIRPFSLGTANLPSHTLSTPELAARSLPTTAPGKHRVQSLRTLPQFHYTTFNQFPENDRISWAPDGLFEIRCAWLKAIKAAERFIYVEDQAFWSIELMSALRDTIQRKPALTVVLVAGVADPTDPKYPPYGLAALSQGLLKGMTSGQRTQVRMFSRDVVVHTKSTIVDDQWAIIGSANFTRRSLYTDIEHSVAFLDDEDLLVRQYRVKLWADAFRLGSADEGKIADIEKALNVWNPGWGVPGSGVLLPPSITTVEFPTPTTLADEEQEKYDRYYDVDSTKPWGGCRS